MRIEICITCIDDGHVPKHRVFNWEVKGNESRDVRMSRVQQLIAKALKVTYGKPTR